MSILKKTSKTTGLILASFLLSLIPQYSSAQTTLTEYSRKAEEYTSSGKTVGCGTSFNGMTEEGLFIQGSLTAIVKFEEEEMLYMFKISAAQVDFDHLMNTGEYLQKDIPLDFAYIQMTVFPGESKQQLFHTKNWTVTSPPQMKITL